MSDRFEALQEKLLRGGIAPRHVRRYLRELEEHLADHAQAYAAAGHDQATAAARARAALGSDEALAGAMLQQRGFQALGSRFPWLVFGVLPLLALSLAVPGLMLLLIAAQAFGAPALFPAMRDAVLFAGNLVLVPGIALLFVLVARRQRIAPGWAILSAGIILILSPHWGHQSVEAISPGFSALRLMYREAGEAVVGGFAPIFLGAWWRMAAGQWAVIAAQYLLILLPLAWLSRRPVRMGASA